MERETSTEVTLEDIKSYLRSHGTDINLFEFGINNLRFDLIRINPWKRYVRIFEIKMNRQDFLRDKKWPKYLKYCHTFTFISPENIVSPGDLPSGIGLMWISKWRWSEYENNIWHWNLEAHWKKRPRKREVEIEVLIDLAFMMLNKLHWRADEFF